MNSRLSSLLALKSQSARPIRPESLSTSEETFISSKPGNELEGLIRDKLPDPVRRHLTDVHIDRVDAHGWLCLLRGQKRRSPGLSTHRGFSEWCSAA